jgi:geranylgeranyl diphosphate synthase, type I
MISSPVAADAAADAELDAAIDPEIDRALAALDGRAPLLGRIARYPLGQVDAGGVPLPPGAVDRGKRIRPAVALLCCGAAGGDPRSAAPLGAAIELLHNFTLVHDDVQDNSPTRRHRPTVWSVWGVGQAINAGDALFAAAHLPLFRLAEAGCPPALVLRLVEAFDRMTIAIVEGQVLDLGFEARADVTPDDYLGMIAGKTAAIVRYAAWAGALLGGADEARADRFAAFGLALGLGFQIQDDALGIWGDAAQTGKAPADDIRRRKQSLPILLLRERLGPKGRAELDGIYAAPEVDGAGAARVLTLLEQAGVRAAVAERVAREHERARAALLAAADPGANPARDRLLALVDRLAVRAG